IPATAWLEAPAELLALGDDLPDRPVAMYKRCIGGWLLWRAGPASRGEARYWAGAANELTTQWTFRLHADGSRSRLRPTGPPGGPPQRRFRTWKEALRAHAAPEG